MQDNMHEMDSEYNLNEIQLVVFKLASEFYAVDILKVKEIKLMTNITRVPHSPDYY